jgi:hypothetical protein
MSNIRLLSVVGLCGVSVSVGAFIGTKYEKLLQTIGTDKSNLKLVESKYYLPAVFASSHPTTTSINSSTAINVENVLIVEPDVYIKKKHGLAKTGNSIKGKCDYLL